MDIRECCKLGWGTVFASAAVGLGAITLIALAVIFAPPFFATALLAGSAIYVAIGCGTGTLISALFAALLLHEKPSRQQHLDTFDPTYLEHQPDQKKALLPPSKQTSENHRITAYLNKEPSLRRLVNHVRNHSYKEEYEGEIQLCLDKIDLTQYPNCENAGEINKELTHLLNRMDATLRKADDNTEKYENRGDDSDSDSD